MTTGSSVVPEAVIRPWLDRGIPVTQVYGLTESGPTAIALSIADATRKPTSCGKPALYCDARVVDADGSDVHRGERLGFKFDRQFLEALKQASGRDK